MKEEVEDAMREAAIVADTAPRAIPAWGDWPTNAELIADVATIGWLRDTDRILDPTWGLGVFWNVWRPTHGKLVGTDLDPDKSPSGRSVDFTDLPFKDGMFDAVVFDPPYKLNGTPDPIEERYGVHEVTKWTERMGLIDKGTEECARVAGDRLLVKCMDQVCSGQIRWQTGLVADVATSNGFRLADRFDMIGHGRPQPRGRTQKHAYERGSTLLVFKRIK